MFAPYYPPHVGGLESYAAELAQELVRHDWMVLVVTAQTARSLPAVEHIAPRLVVYRLPSVDVVSGWPMPAVWRLSWWRLMREVWQRKPTVVVSHTRFFLFSVLAGLFARTKRCHWTHIEHGSAYVQVSNRFVTVASRVYDELLGRVVLWRCDEVVAISQAVARFVRRAFGRTSRVVYRGLPTDVLESAAPRRPQNVPADRLLLISVGRLVAWKGVARALVALQLLPPDAQRRVAYVVVGDGPEAQQLATLAERSAVPVVFTGALPARNTISILKAADIYLHCSYPGGGLSTALLEAMWCGRAVVATPHEGAAEFVTHSQTGLLVSEGDEQAFADAVYKLVNDQTTRRRLGSAARRLVQDRISWKQTGAQLTSLWPSVHV